MKKYFILILLFIGLLGSLGYIRQVRQDESPAPSPEVGGGEVSWPRDDKGDIGITTNIDAEKDTGITPNMENANQNFTRGPGDYDVSLTVGGLSRRYLLHVPPGYDRQRKNPLVLALHGGMGSAELMARNYGLKEKADRAGFIVAFPNGTSRLPSGKLATWNAGDCCGYARDNNINDVAFLRVVVDDIKTKFNVGNVFAIGMSNGGMMSYRLACEAADMVTAIAAVAGTDNVGICNPSKPISILHIHAKDDDHVLFDGGAGPAAFKDESKVTDFTSVPETISMWVERNRCAASSARMLEKTGAYCDLYAGCAEGVEVKLCVTASGGHSWPGRDTASSNTLETGVPSSALSANDVMWSFFAEQQ